MTQLVLLQELPRPYMVRRREQPKEDDEKPVRNIATTDLDSEHECDPLIVRSVRSIISTFNTIQVNYAL